MSLLRILSLTSVQAVNWVIVQVGCHNFYYDINGVSNGPITAAEGDTLGFVMNANGTDCSNHPMDINDAIGNNVPGVVGNGAISGQMNWTLPAGSAGMYGYACENHALQMFGNITIRPTVKASVPTGVTATALSTTTALVTWVAGQPNDCVVEGWSVTHVAPSPLTGPVAGCTNLPPTATNCTATGLTASHAFSVQATCTNSVANSDSQSTGSFSVAPAAAVTGLTAVARTATTVFLSWTRGVAQGACQILDYQVRTVTPVAGSVAGCGAVGPGLFCLATNLSANTAYTFSVKQTCTNSAFDSPTANANAMTKNAVNVNVTCTTSNTAYLINGVPNANVTVTAGDSVIFSLTNCAAYPFTIQNSGVTYDQGVTNNGAVLGTVQLDTNSSTPTPLKYVSASFAAMTGFIIVRPPVVKASTPGTPSVTTVQGLPHLAISWSAGASAGGCVFANWRVTFDGSPNSVVPGCTTFPNVSVTSCTAIDLNGSTAYSFRVQRECVDPAANSAVSSASTSRTTISTIGIKICQNVNTCNCGNATTCTCQLTSVCNCQNAGTCVCQGGTCNGGNAGLLVCNFPTGCNKQCAKSCPVCLGDTISGLFGSKSCVSGSMMVSASGVLLAILSLLM